MASLLLRRGRGRWFIVLTFLLAFMLEILPLPAFVVWLRPAWTLLVLIYWAMALPEVVSVGWAFVAGILVDILTGTLLGEHALAFVLVTYVVIKSYKLLRVYPVLQQTLIVFLLMLGVQLYLYIVQSIIHQRPHTALYWLSSVVSALLWSWVFVVLRDWRRRLQVA